MENIITKSMMKFNPQSKELSDMISFIPLIQIDNHRIKIDPRGLKVIESQVLGDVHLVALEGDRQSLLYNFYKSTHIMNQLSQERKISGIWISSFPRYDPYTETQYLFLETSAVSYEDRISIHTICSLLCSCILIGMDEANLWFLASLQGRILYNRNSTSEKADKDARKKQLAHLVLYELVKGKQALKGTHNQIYQFLMQKKVYLECESAYKSLHMLRIAIDRIESQQWQYVQQLEQEIRNICNMQPKDDDLRNGPMLNWYLQAVVASLNGSQNVEIKQCLNGIEVEQGYNAFLGAVQIYHQRVKRQMKEEGVANLKQVLTIAREEANDEYKKISSDAQYLAYLGDYIDFKQKRLTQENNKILDLRNINFLKNQSEELLSKVTREKMNRENAQKEIELFTEKYKSQAVGDNKYQLLTGYQEYLTAAVYKYQIDQSRAVSDRENKKMKKQVQAVNEEKKQLEQRIKQLQSRSNRRSRDEGCCSSCQIM